MFFAFGIVIALVTIILDQLSKYWLLSVFMLPNRGTIEVLPFFNLVSVWNHGVSFGMLRDIGVDNSMALIALASGLTIALLVWLKRVGQRLLAGALGLVIGGAIGNIIDRSRLGAVYDFLDFHAYGFHWPAFNIADSAICIGVCLILLDSFLCTTKPKQH